MNISAQRRKREAQALIKQGWTVVPMQQIKYRDGISDYDVNQQWLAKQQEQQAWCQQHAKLSDFRFVHPNFWIFKDRGTALLFKLSLGGE